MIDKMGAAVLVGFCLMGPAGADDAAPDSDHGRFSLTKVADGYLRLDTQTGDVSLCTQRAVGWACQAVPDDRAVLEQEITRLRGENGALKKEILTNGLPLPAGATADTSDSDRSVTLRLPSNQEIDSALAYAGSIWHRLVDAVTRAQKQIFNKS